MPASVKPCRELRQAGTLALDTGRFITRVPTIPMDCPRLTGYGAKTEPGAATDALGGFLALLIALNTIIK